MMRSSASAPDSRIRRLRPCGPIGDGMCRKGHADYSLTGLSHNSSALLLESRDSRLKSITIVGGGLAGLCAGIGLRLQSVPVTLIEAREFPRHKVCGEFISGNGLDVLAQNGFDPGRMGVPVKTISFHHRGRSSNPALLPEPGLGIPRFELDFAMARRFMDLGGDLKCPCRFESTSWGEQFV